MGNIDICMKMIGLGVIPTLLAIRDKYYEYGADGLETKR